MCYHDCAMFPVHLPSQLVVFDCSEVFVSSMNLPPWAQELMDSRMSRDDPEANCLPTGIPRIAPFPWRIVQAPLSGKATHYYFLFEGNIHSYRQIFMDGREHPEDPELSW